MCGIFGLYERSGRAIDFPAIQRATTLLRHRGPDDEGYFLTNTTNGKYALGGGKDTPENAYSSGLLYTLHDFTDSSSLNDHYNLSLSCRRLAILDLSSAGHQPMCNEDRKIWIVYNGEVYNFEEIRRELITLGHKFASNTDTEVIVHAYEEWDISCLHKFNGMWAFAIWDARKKIIFCARDRCGIKPFYYRLDNKGFVFGSEIKALLEATERTVNDEMVYCYLAFGRLGHSEQTFFTNIKELRGGHHLVFDTVKSTVNIKPYWNIDLDSKQNIGKDEEYTRRFYDIFESAVQLRLISDVPVGTCLSGGLDSSSIVCTIDRLMRQKGVKVPGGKVQKTFSARYSDPRHDEGRFISDVINTANVDSYYVYPKADDLCEALTSLIWQQDEPFPSTSIFAQWCVFKLAKNSGVKVTLDGQGADELLAGYFTYLGDMLGSLIRESHWFQLGREFVGLVSEHPESLMSNVLRALFWNLPASTQKGLSHRVSGSDGRTWMNDDFAKAFKNSTNPSISMLPHSSFLDWRLHQAITKTSLPVLLRYADRNSMAHSIEARFPFLDYRLIEYVFSLLCDQRIRHGVTKYVLRKAMCGILPESIRLRRDKVAFSTPEDMWLRKTLQPLVMEIFNSTRFLSQRYLDAQKIREVVHAFFKGQKSSGLMWRWISLELWLRTFFY